jgi:serine/threonine protein kinase
LIERAQKNLQDYVKTWKDPQATIEAQEFFSEEKLFYIFFKTMQALAFLHSNNIYYGDLKEDNIQIFRDFSIKLGDFGVSIKMKDFPAKYGSTD